MIGSRWVTVVIPTFNRAHLLGETIQSVFAQTYDCWDIIVVDDGSTDNTADVVTQFPADRVKYLAQEHSGLPNKARNFGIRYAKGRFIAFLDSDDLWLPEKLATQVPLLMENTKVGLVCGDIEIFGPVSKDLQTMLGRGGGFRSGNILAELYKENFVNTSTAIVRRDCFETVGLFDENPAFIGAEDYHMWLRIAAHYELIYMPRVLALYRVHEGRISAVHDGLCGQAEVLIDIVSRYLHHFDQLAMHPGWRIADVYKNLGFWTLEYGEPLEARRWFEKALEWRPHDVWLSLLWTLSGLHRFPVRKLLSIKRALHMKCRSA